MSPEPKSPKTLVVGSSGHEHVTCVAWTDLKSVNLKDFDVIVFNVVSLDDEMIVRLPDYGYFDGVRRDLSLLLRSGGKIIALTPERRAIKQKDDWRTNWDWCPFEIKTQQEAGDTIERRRKEFERYLSNLKHWTFYLFVTNSPLTNELMNVFGNPYETNYQFPTDAYAVNRYGKMLAGEVPLLITSADGHNGVFGSITVLPVISELEQKEAIGLVLEDLLGEPQRSLPPDWVDQIPMPFVDAINDEISRKNTTIETLRQEIVAGEQRRAEIEKWKKLVYATGRELEQVFEDALHELGGKIKPAISEEEFIFEYKGKTGVVECKGVSKSITLQHVRQADSHVLNFIDTENIAGKGVLLGNAWRNLPLSERNKSDTPVFPDNVVRHAAQREIALVGAGDFLEAFCRFLEGEVSGEAILDAMTTQSGVVDF